MDSLKKVKVYSHGEENLCTQNKAFEKRPKKENEEIDFINQEKYDPVFDKYGYVQPEQIKPGHLTLMQIDEFIINYKTNKSVDFINEFAEKNKMSVTDIYLMIEYYKPFLKIDSNTKNESKSGSNVIDSSQQDLKIIFPNIK